MTAKSFSRPEARKPVLAALALLIGFGISASALATELKPPAGKSKLLNDSDVTIIILDRNDSRSTSQIGVPGRSQSSSVGQPSSRIKRNDDDLTIRFKRNDSTRSGTIVRSGPKVIIVDRNSDGCGGSSVCVIRP
jgi:hypothetical protein